MQKDGCFTPSVRHLTIDGLTPGLLLRRVCLVQPLEQNPPDHREEDPDHAEERGLEPEERHQQRERRPDQFAHLEVQRLNHPHAAHELEELQQRIKKEKFKKIDNIFFFREIEVRQ